jgi:hypothetical protein
LSIINYIISNHIKVEVAVRKGLSAQSVVPPFLRKRPKAVFLHDRTQEISLLGAFYRGQRGIVMRSLPEIVEMAAHKLGPIVSVYYLGAISESVVEK